MDKINESSEKRNKVPDVIHEKIQTLLSANAVQYTKISELETKIKNQNEFIAGQVMYHESLLETNRKIKENIIDKAIEKCDERIIEVEKELTKGFRDEQVNLLNMRKYSYEEMKTFLESIK